jgi:hypothetical protein
MASLALGGSACICICICLIYPTSMYNALCKATKPIACGINIVKKVNYSTLTIVLEELKLLFNAAIDS